MIDGSPVAVVTCSIICLGELCSAMELFGRGLGSMLLLSYLVGVDLIELLV